MAATRAKVRPRFLRHVVGTAGMDHLSRHLDRVSRRDDDRDARRDRRLPAARAHVLRRLSTWAVMALGMVALGAPAGRAVGWADAGAGLSAICVVRGVGFAIFTIAGTVSTGEIAPAGRHGELAGLYGLAATVPNVVLVPLSVLLLHDVGFWPVAGARRVARPRGAARVRRRVGRRASAGGGASGEQRVPGASRGRVGDRPPRPRSGVCSRPRPCCAR